MAGGTVTLDVHLGMHGERPVEEGLEGDTLIVLDDVEGSGDVDVLAHPPLAAGLDEGPEFLDDDG